MTDDNMTLLGAIQKSDDGDFLKTVAEAALQRIMDFDVENLIGAGRHERSADRLAYRNGYRERSLETRLGTLDLKIPKLRSGEAYFPAFLEPRRTIEKALTAVIQEAWIAGVSTRRVESLIQAMGMSGISKSQVSKLCKEIDERVNSFLERPLDGDWPYLWLDATYLKQREGGRIVSVAAIIAVAANTEGRREIIGLSIGASEAAAFWIDFLRSLARRGLKNVKLVISDAHEGLKAAISQVLGATWQRCRVHTMRNLLSRVPKAQQSRVATMIREVFVQPTQQKARELWRAIAASAHNAMPKLSEAMDAAENDVLAYMTFPPAHRQKLHSTNTLERLNKEVKRRADVVGIFPNEASIVRLIGAVLMEQNDEWQLQHRYLSLEPLADLPQLGQEERSALVPPADAFIIPPRTA
jgi:transposase-like protein